MTWRIFLTDSSQPDLDSLTPTDRAAITDELFAWVPDGPPRTRSQVVTGVQPYEDQLRRGSASPTSSTIRSPMSPSSVFGGADPCGGVSHNRLSLALFRAPTTPAPSHENGGTFKSRRVGVGRAVSMEEYRNLRQSYQRPVRRTLLPLAGIVGALCCPTAAVL